MLAVVKKQMKADNDGKLFAPPKQDKPHKQQLAAGGAAARGSQAGASEHASSEATLALAYAVPMPLGMLHVPCGVASPRVP